MATDEFWAKHRSFLLESEHSPLRRLPMPHEALIAFGPMSALGHALDLLVLDRPAEANALLGFVPRLREVLRDPEALAHRAEHERMQSAGHLRQALHVGTWLLTGAMDAALARDAFEHMLVLNRWWGRRFTPPNLLDLMLLAVEGDDHSTAVALYREHERKPVSLPPRDLKFASNVRSVLAACLAGPGAMPEELRSRAVESLRARATRWERSVTPVPYVMRIDLARVLRACHLLLGRPHDLATIVPLVA